MGGSFIAPWDKAYACMLNVGAMGAWDVYLFCKSLAWAGGGGGGAELWLYSVFCLVSRAEWCAWRVPCCFANG